MKKGSIKTWIKENADMIAYGTVCVGLVTFALITDNKRSKAIALQRKKAEEDKKLLIDLAEMGASVYQQALNCVNGFVSTIDVKCDDNTFVRFTPEKITVE